MIESERIEIVHDCGYFPVVAVLSGNRTAAERLLVVFRAGAGHFGLGGRLEATWSQDGGRGWSKPVVVAESERDDRNPAIGVTSSGEVVVAYHHQGSYGLDGKWQAGGAVDTLLTRSSGGGSSWSRPYSLSYEALRGRSPFRKMVTMPGGEMLLNAYGSPNAGEEGYASYLLRSHDNGLTWAQPSTIAVGFHETALALLPAGELLAAMRSREQPDAVWLSRSEDGGRTWSLPDRLTEKGEHPADLLVLGDGRVLLTYGRRREPFGVEGRVSADGGRTWGPVFTLANDAPNVDCGYPCSVQLADGSIITVYYATRADAERYFGTGCRAYALLYGPEALPDG